ncbi:MAG: site-2 protease family protein [DPANN group archaeon]|nr:site-2 protease family protein [DPANN group archaeon]
MEKIAFPLLYFVMYRAKWGVKAMDRMAKRYKQTVKWFGLIGIGFGVVGMLLMSVELVRNAIMVFITEEVIPGVGVVLPIQAKGVFFVPFIYWIISIFQVASVHEFAHGVVARRFGMKIKNSGLAFLGIIVPLVPAAFVEPDDKQMAKKRHLHQQAMFSAGPFINIIMGGLFFLLLIGIMIPLAQDISKVDGMEVVILAKGEGGKMFPAEAAGLSVGDVITTLDGVPMDALENFTSILRDKHPGDTLAVETSTKGKEHLTITLTQKPKNASLAYFGLSVSPHSIIAPAVKERYGILADAFLWTTSLIFFMFLLNLGIGLFNLLPMGPVDGGRMLKLASTDLFGEKRGILVWKAVSYFFFAVLLFLLYNSFFG